MSLRDIVVNGIAIADSLTQDLQPTVLHQSWVSSSSGGTRDLAAAVSRKAVIVQKLQMVRLADGREVASRAYITFLRPVTVTLKDKFTLPDGFTGPVLNIEGMLDPQTGQGFLKEIYLG